MPYRTTDNPPRVGADIDADPATPFGAEAERQQQTSARGGLLYVLQDGACVDGVARGKRIDLSDRVHELQTHDGLVARSIRCRAAAITCVAPLGDERDPEPYRQFHDVGDLLRRCRLQDGERRSGEELALIGGVGYVPLRAVDDACGAQEIAKNLNVIVLRAAVRPLSRIDTALLAVRPELEETNAEISAC